MSGVSHRFQEGCYTPRTLPLMSTEDRTFRLFSVWRS